MVRAGDLFDQPAPAVACCGETVVSEVLSDVPCELCRADSCVLNFGAPCCVARFIGRLKSLEQRQGWMARMSKRKSAAFMLLVEQRLGELFAERKRKR